MNKKTTKRCYRKDTDGVLETLDILANKKEVEAIAEGEKNVRRGATVPLSKYIASKTRL